MAPARAWGLSAPGSSGPRPVRFIPDSDRHQTLTLGTIRAGFSLRVFPKIDGQAQMKNHVYKILEIVGSSETSIEDAVSSAIGHASKTVRNMDWFEVTQTRGHIENGKIGHYQVTLKIGFTLEG
jgi:flavin-binding protein dodecin